MSKTAILLLAHGTPDELSDIPKYLSNVVSGRPMPQHVVDEITHRYGQIGKSPLTALTLQQGQLLSQAIGLPVYVGMRNWKPYIVDTVRQMKADGVTEAVAICLAPQNSRTSTGLYRRATFAEAGDALRIEFIEGWADHPKLADAFAARLQPVLARMGEETGGPASVLFTAHSVPCRTIQTPVAGAPPAGRPGAAGAPAANGVPPSEGAGSREQSLAPEERSARVSAGASMVAQAAEAAPVARAAEATMDLPLPAAPGAGTSPAAGTAPPTATPAPPHEPAAWVLSAAEVPARTGRPPLPPDPYPLDAKRTAALVAERIPGLGPDRWYFAFQSQGMAGGPWIGPTVEDTLTALHAQGVRAVVLHTIGFLCDHVEILYDIDIAFREFAENLGIRLERPASLNDSPLLTEALVDLAQGGLARLAAAPVLAEAH